VKSICIREIRDELLSLFRPRLSVQLSMPVRRSQVTRDSSALTL